MRIGGAGHQRKPVPDTWHILGAGAIGSLMACKLRLAGIDCRLLHRNVRGGADIRPVELLEGGERRAFRIPGEAPSDLVPASVRRLLITTKAHQAVAAYEAIRPALADDARVVLLHNGMGVYEQIRERFPGARPALGITTEGAYWRSGNLLVRAGRGDTSIGQRGRPAPPAWFAPLADRVERTFWASDIDASLWRKLVINCAINPLTAVHGCTNGEIAGNPALWARARAVCAELGAVSRARGYPDLADAVENLVRQVAEATAANHSSMLRDVRRGRATEIDHITGYFCGEADRLGIPCPTNRALLEAVRKLDSTANPA